MNKRSGFTITELLLTITILGLILGYGVPSLNSFVRRNQVVRCLRTLTVALNTARYYAIERNIPVKYQLRKNRVELLKKKSGSWCVHQTFDLPEKVDVHMNACPVFYPVGTVSPLCSIKVRYHRYRYCVTLSMAGRIRVAKVSE